MSKPKVMIRGIYTTALTKFLTDRGYVIAQPSAATAERFNLNKVHERDVAIVDRPDKQGVTVEGEADPAESVVLVLLKALPDMIVREITLPKFLEEQRSGRFSLQTGFLSFDVEFPYGSKILLDNIRSQVTATINNHHLLKIVDPDTVDMYETMLKSEPERKEDISSLAQKKLIHERLTFGRSLQIHHVKPDGSIIKLSEARILSFEGRTLSLQRRIMGNGSKYDGLDVAKVSTDYAVTVAEEGSPTLKHSYHAEDGSLKGEFYNINTPIEFYPDKFRYVDLEIDVVRGPGEPPKIIDSDKLDEAVEYGYMSSALAEVAKDIARNLAAKLAGT